ncbi:hypothetical protein L517_2326 [Bordetella bronchiseptica MBORD670]|nr:hypothetical protein L517_2326 [Bordetella bronchiseptica MBORD670]
MAAAAGGITHSPFVFRIGLAPIARCRDRQACVRLLGGA